MANSRTRKSAKRKPHPHSGAPHISSVRIRNPTRLQPNLRSAATRSDYMQAVHIHATHKLAWYLHACSRTTGPQLPPHMHLQVVLSISPQPLDPHYLIFSFYIHRIHRLDISAYLLNAFFPNPNGRRQHHAQRQSREPTRTQTHNTI
ncbi:uncharacterized protein EI90DRAFT_1737126 [Cantharellus anzutake]|uniref:uncharacterized protein n=1 Tax=Cantharellus anzutake TaxID=1750568 RepID=UPI00190789E4|nr:uncharacterized protein EI90DRAFT_1737126 [Cantharellus anzutake]KAF8341418.1 hypothetical protein EI90DRAFT_1737126 [Cantharellus anzutake]